MDKKFRRSVSRRNLGSGPVNGAGALIYCSGTKRYLFVLRNGHAHDGSWGIVGGKVESEETVIQGLYREIQEEIGLDLSGNKIIPVEKFTSDRKHFVYHTFLIRVDSEFIPNLNAEHRGYCWVSLTDYPKPLHPGVWRTFNFQTVIDKLETLQTVL
jgi:8-oxo-dGTP diphosphatase